MLDVVSIGSALIDIFVHSDQFSLKSGEQGVLLCQRLGDKVEVDNFVLQTGGGGGNTAVGFARMGFNAGVICETGRDAWSKIVVDEFHREYVSTNYLVSERLENTGGSVILNSGEGDRTVLVHRGASSMLNPHDIPEKALPHFRWVHLSSIAGQLETIKIIFEAVRGVGLAKLSWNPGSSELNLIDSGQIPVNSIPAEVLFLNQEEWEKLSSRHQELIGQIPQIIITNGSEGGVLLQQGEEIRYKAIAGEVVDSTGAGDAFAVGYVSAVLYKKEPQEALRWGARNAHSVIKQIGAKPGLLKKMHMEIE